VRHLSFDVARSLRRKRRRRFDSHVRRHSGRSDQNANAAMAIPNFFMAGLLAVTAPTTVNPEMTAFARN